MGDCLNQGKQAFCVIVEGFRREVARNQRLSKTGFVLSSSPPSYPDAGPRRSAEVTWATIQGIG